jgi:transposase
VSHAQCWAHTRRAFERAEKSEPQAVSEALAIISQLYRHEEAMRQRKLLGQAKQDYCARHCLAVVENFFGWLHTQATAMTCTTAILLPRPGLCRRT